MSHTAPHRDTSHERTLTYACPHCNGSVDVLENLLGETIECPVCDRPFLVQPPAGRPLSPEETAAVGKHVRADLPLDDEHVDRVIHPVVLRRHFLATAVCAVLLVAAIVAVVMGLAGSPWMAIPAIGLLIGGCVLALVSGFFLAKWFIASRMQSLTLTSERLIYRYGIIHRGTSEMRYEDIRNMKLNQNIVERLLGFGDMALSSAGQDDMEIVINDIPRPQQVADYIRQRQD